MMARMNGVLALQIGMELESTGQVFYELAASSCPRQLTQIETLLVRLAKDEEDHYRTFEDLLAKHLAQAGQCVPSLSDETKQEIQQLIRERIVPDPAAAMATARKGDMLAVLDLAIELERRTREFYTENLPPATDEADLAVVQKILDEEKQHEQDLKDTRRSVSA